MSWFDKLVNWFDGFCGWGPDGLLVESTHIEDVQPLPPARDHIEELYTELGGEQ